MDKDLLKKYLIQQKELYGDSLYLTKKAREIIQNMFKPEMNSLFDSNIQIDEAEHRYFLADDPKAEFTSSTTFIHKFFEPFDMDKVADNLISNVPKYAGTNKNDLIKSWTNSAGIGTFVHNELEEYIKTFTTPTHIKSRQGVDWIKSKNFKECKLYPEVIIFSKTVGISGMVDLLIHNKEKDKYFIVDWKTNKKIYTESYKNKMGIKNSTKNLMDCNFIHYSLQLSLYRYLLEKFYGLDIHGQIILHLQEDSYKEYSCPYLKDEVINMLKEDNKLE